MMFNIERFHNQLALLLGYERIVNDKMILISVEEPDDPWVTLKIQGTDEKIRFRASENIDDMDLEIVPEMKNEIKTIRDAVHQAYIVASNNKFW